MKKLLVLLAAGAVVSCSPEEATTSIDRQALVTRNNIRVEKLDPLASVSVGNGRFAFTVDGTGLQTFPDYYHPGVPLGTFSEWGWHAFPNPENLTHDETLRNYNFRGWEEPYSIEYKDGSRNAEASKWFRVNPHRMHLGYLGLELTDSSGSPVAPESLGSIDLTTDLWNGNIESSFTVGDTFVEVQTACSPDQDLIAARVKSPGLTAGNVKLNLRFGYPTGGHSDNATDWSQPEKHSTKIVEQGDNFAILERKLDETTYYVKAQWSGNASLSEKQAHYFVLSPESDEVSVSVLYTDEKPSTQALAAFPDVLQAASGHWHDFWMSGAAVDFSDCTDPRAAELERRVVLSQYLTAIQNTQGVPPAESGLTYNTWFGRPHLEMHWWHGVHFPLWGRDNLLEKSLAWYENAAFEGARKIAERQQFDGVRWMKMTDNWANEAPSSVGSFLIWQQPHVIYFAELLYRNNPSPEVLEKYKDVVLETANFMGSFPTYEEVDIRYILEGYIPAQETLRASEVINSPFELSYWHYALGVAQQWRERLGMERDPKWDDILDKLSPLAAQDGKYLASEDAIYTYSDIRFTTDHPIVLGAMGVLPQNKLMSPEIMKNTFDWIWDNWNWGRTWGWDFPMTAMCAARLNMPDKAVGALLMDKKTNTYLVNGHNYQDDRLRIYLPGNGGLLTAVAMMCAGWDGSEGKNPGFPADGTWNVKWEGLSPMP